MSESLDFIFERVNSALITQDFEYAERLLTNALKKYRDILPNDKDKIESLLARIYGDEGKLDQALEVYLRLYERRPDNVDLMLNLGRIYRHLGRYENALEILKKARSIGGDTDETLYNFAKTYKRMGRYDEAADYFSRAIELKPDHAHAYDRLGNLYVLTGDTDEAIEVYKKGLRVDQNHPYLNFHLAKLLHQEKRYEEAIAYYNSALRINPAWGEVLSGIAAAYLQLDRLDDALNAYRLLLHITGENASLYTELGCLFEKKQLLQEAEGYYRNALAVDFGFAPAVLALTRLLESRQRYSEALPILLAAETDPANADNHVLRLKAVQMCMYAKDYAKAYELLGRLDEEYGNSLDALKLRGQLYALTGEVEQAEETFKQVLKQAPSAIEFRQELAEQYLLAHKYEQAKEQLQLFLKQRPSDISALMVLGRTEELLNNPQAAYQEYQKVLQLKPNAIEARSALSRLFQKSGDTLEALKTASEILNLQSSSETDIQEQDIAASIDLYEQAAKRYIADPLLTKNLEQLKSNDSHLYISPTELPSAPNEGIPTLMDISKSEQELPFEMLIEGTEEIEELPPEKDDIAIETVQLSNPRQQDVSDQTDFLNFSNTASDAYEETAGSLSALKSNATGDSSTVPQIGKDTAIISPRSHDADVFATDESVPISGDENFVSDNGAFTPDDTVSAIGNDRVESPIDELSLDPESTENDGAIESGVVSQKNTQSLHKRQTLLRDEAIQDRLMAWDTYGTTIGFLQDVISDIDKQLESNRYTQVVEILAERIAENLSRKIPLHTDAPQEEPETIGQPDESFDMTNTLDEVAEAVEEAAVPDDEDSIQLFDEPEDAVLGVEENDLSIPEPDETSVVEIAEEETMEEEGIAEEIEDTESEEEEESTHNQAPFILDQEQQNLLWCHAKHQIKDPLSFEQYLNATDPKHLAQLFSYLQDLFIYLPQKELEVFLNSSERIQIHYIIARLSGKLGLKDRAALIHKAGTAASVQSTYNEEAVFTLLAYLRDLSIALPDQELGARVRKELEQLMSNMSSVLSHL